MRRRHILACLLGACVVAGCAPQQSSRRADPPGIAPVLDGEFADPFVLPVDGDRLVAYATNRTEADGTRTHLPVSTSADGVHWSRPAEAMPAPPPWARAQQPDIWAPEAMRVGERYIVFFSARHASLRRADGLTLCIGAAVAASPTGPFVPLAAPLSCGGAHGVIDVSPLRAPDADGRERLWLLYKTDGNCCGAATTFLVQRLREDGLALEGPAQVLDGVRNDQPWEGKVVEAPQMVHAHGRWWLFYAGNDYGGGAYATGYARCDGPLGPCHDAAENPILRSEPGPPALVGPGHQSVFRHAGRTWIAFHGWRQPAPGGPRYRAMYILPLDWREGRPVPAR